MTEGLSIVIQAKRFREAHRPLIQDLSLHVKRGECVSILGPSGSGKTTLLRIIAGLDTDYLGRVELDGVPVTAPSKRIQVLFQEGRLFPWMTALQNARFGMSGSPSDRTRTARDLLARLGIASRENAWPRQLSGGEQSRVALARSLGANAKVLLLDEPFRSLDLVSKTTVLRQLADLVPAGTTLVFVSHDIMDAVVLSDRVLVLDRDPLRVTAEFPVLLARPHRTTDPEAVKLASKIANEIEKLSKI